MTGVRISSEEAADCIAGLWGEAYRLSGFDTICSLLRVTGMEDAGWDPFSETEAAFEDYNWYLKAQDAALSGNASWRIALLMYCQAVEISAVHDTLGNILRILLGQRYHISPFSFLGQKRKNRLFDYRPPSAKQKWREIRKLAVEAGQEDLTRIIDAIFNDAVRNAFSHSDYIITDTHFRWTESGHPSEMPLEEMDNLIASAFNFTGRFIAIRRQWLGLVGRTPRYYKGRQYMVYEHLKDENQDLIGFKVHFSNGTTAHFSRSATGVDCMNILFGADGVIEFMVGLLDDLEPTWKVDGRPVDFGDKTALDEF